MFKEIKEIARESPITKFFNLKHVWNCSACILLIPPQLNYKSLIWLSWLKDLEIPCWVFIEIKKKLHTYVVVSFHEKLTTQKTLFIIKRVFAHIKSSEFKWGVIKIHGHLCTMEWFKGGLLSKECFISTLLKSVSNVQCILTKYWMRYIHWIGMFFLFILDLN